MGSQLAAGDLRASSGRGAVVARYLPAVAEVRRVDDPSGVAVGSWILVALTGLLWGGYGLTSQSVALVGYGAVLLFAPLQRSCCRSPDRRAGDALALERLGGRLRAAG